MKKYSSVRLEITSDCNLNCEYCHNQEFNNKRDDMDVSEILQLIKELKQKFNIHKILITGGEPLTNPHVFNIIGYITDLGIKADMVTNGVLLDKTTVKRLEEAGLKRIRLSIDEVCDVSKVRLGTNPNSIWEKAKLVRENSNIEVCIHTVCSMVNVDSLFTIYEKVLESGAKRWRVFDIGFQGGTENMKNDFNPLKYYSELISSSNEIIKDYLSRNLKKTLDIEINNIFRTQLLDVNADELEKLDFNEMLNERLNKSPCDYVADHQITVRSNGVATLCQYFHNPIYDFRRHGYDVNKTFNKEIYCKEKFLYMEEVKPCANCKYCLVCNGGCRARAQYLTEDITDADPVGCYMYQLIFDKIVPILPENVQRAYKFLINKNGSEAKYSEKNLERFFREKGYDCYD